MLRAVSLLLPYVLLRPSVLLSIRVSTLMMMRGTMIMAMMAMMTGPSTEQDAIKYTHTSCAAICSCVCKVRPSSQSLWQGLGLRVAWGFGTWSHWQAVVLAGTWCGVLTVSIVCGPRMMGINA